MVKAKLQHDIKTADKTVFIACDVVYQDGVYLVSTQYKKSGTSAILTNMLGDVALLIQDETSSDLKVNDKVKILIP
jgi:molybdopterin molybdotransferase